MNNHEKSSKKVRGHSIDRISDLIDSLKCHVLSFLPTVNAVETSFLSTKWRNIWTSLPNLSFVESPDDQSFPRFVNRVLLFHNAPSIHKFSLSCLKNSASYDVYSWITTAILKNVQELDVSLEGIFYVPLPISIFTCKTLEKLKLEGSILIKVPTNTLTLPKLTTLELIDVNFQNDESARNFISSCTSLETLYVARGLSDNVGIFIIKHSTLRHLTIDTGVVNFPDLPKIVVNTPGLQNLILLNSTIMSFEIQDVSSSLKVKAITQYRSQLRGIVNCADLVSNFLQGIRNVNTLNMTQEVFQASLPGHRFPKFDNLTTLEVVAYCCEWGSLQHFLKNSKYLKALTFTKDVCLNNRSEHRTCWINPDSVPSCLETSLETVSLVDFEYFEDELAMVEYILKHGLVMRALKIRVYLPLFSEEIAELFQTLLAFR